MSKMRRSISPIVLCVIFFMTACQKYEYTDPEGLVIKSEDGLAYRLICPLDEMQQKWEKLVFAREKLNVKIEQDEIGEVITTHESEKEEYSYTIYNRKGKEESEIKIFKQPNQEYAYIISQKSYLEYEKEADSRTFMTSDGAVYIVLRPDNKKYTQRKWEKLAFKKEKLKNKIKKNMLGEIIEHYEDESVFTMYHIKGKEDSEIKIIEKPNLGYIYVIPYESYVKYEEEAG